MEILLEEWKKRKLTLFGKVQVIKSLAIASITYTASCCIVPSDAVKRINKILFSFIWDKMERIKRSTLVSRKTDGGLGMLDIQTQFEALKAAWIPRILKCEHEPHWKELPNKYLRRFGKDHYVLKTSINDINVCPVLKLLPRFYQEIIIGFTKSKNITLHDSLYDQTLFGNRFLTCNILSKKTSPYFINWINSGISCVKDIPLDNGVIDEQYIYNKIDVKIDIYAEIANIKRCLKQVIFSTETLLFS